MKILPLTQLLIGKNKSIYVLEVTLSLCQDTVESWDLVIKIKEEKEEIDCDYIIMNFVNISNLKLEIKRGRNAEKL